jgi:serine/threonine protein kinase
MKRPFRLLKFVGKAVVNYVSGGALGQLADALPDLVKNVWNWWSGGQDEAQLRDELQSLAQATADDIAQQVRAVVAEVAGDQPETTRQQLTTYLTQVPAAVRQTLRHPTDPTGTTIPPGFSLRRAEDLLSLLPARLPRFKPGDRPLNGVDWELEELLGVGGFGEVWKARNPQFPGIEPVALKFCLDPEVARTLHHEAAVLDRVMQHGRHPGIVTLRQAYLRADPPCLEYELITGGDMAGLIQQWQKSGGPRPEQAARVMLHLARTVGYAHRLNPPIVHRDLKPANVLVQRAAQGGYQFKVADFGIGGLAARTALTQATRQRTGTGLLQTSLARGSYTLLYASPQQIRGEPPDPRDDVHALGVIWYQLLTGDLGTGRPGGMRWRERLAERGMPPELTGLLGKCFEDEPSDRHADADVLADRIQRALALEPPELLPDRPGPKSSRAQERATPTSRRSSGPPLQPTRRREAPVQVQREEAPARSRPLGTLLIGGGIALGLIAVLLVVVVLIARRAPADSRGAFDPVGKTGKGGPDMVSPRQLIVGTWMLTEPANQLGLCLEFSPHGRIRTTVQVKGGPPVAVAGNYEFIGATTFQWDQPDNFGNVERSMFEVVSVTGTDLVLRPQKGVTSRYVRLQ